MVLNLSRTLGLRSRPRVIFPNGRPCRRTYQFEPGQQFSFWFLRIFLVSGLARFLAGMDWRMSGRNWRRLCEGEGLEQVLPRGKDQKCRDRREIVEELAARAELLPGRAPEFVADVADGVNGEGEKVQGHEDGGEL